jgi:hypothetical protein
MSVIQHLSAEVRVIADLLKAASVDDTVTYAAMSQAIGQPIQAKRYLALRALEVANKESGAIFGSVRCVGYQRLPAQEAHVLGSHTRGRIRKAAARTIRHITAALDAANDMPMPAKLKAYTEINSLALARHIASDKQITAATGDAKAEPVAVVMRRFAQQIVGA